MSRTSMSWRINEQGERKGMMKAIESDDEEGRGGHDGGRRMEGNDSERSTILLNRRYWHETKNVVLLVRNQSLHQSSFSHPPEGNNSNDESCERHCEEKACGKTEEEGTHTRRSCSFNSGFLQINRRLLQYTFQLPGARTPLQLPVLYIGLKKG
mmetsp:Transcript_4631/g.16840  ORF Transcript_4631/g.16840 Transcript_4631/m.16840 type:complete len:154 (-) Transcript_4631:831-1292(-)